MAKKILNTGKMTYNGGTPFGVTSVNYSASTEDVDVTDTNSPTGENEYLGSGRLQHNIDVTFFKDSTVADFTLGGAGASLEMDFEGFTYAGTIIWLNKGTAGQVKGAITQTYSGRFTGTVTPTPEV